MNIHTTLLINSIRNLCITLFALIISSCSGLNIQQYEANNPKISLPDFFTGEMTAHGILKDRNGDVTRYFNADLIGTWSEDGVGTLAELFLFDDGEVQERIWTLTPNGQGQYVGTANDVTGSSLTDTSGNALFMKYVLQVPYKSKVIDVKVDDRMYLVNDNLLINESILTKFGFKVGSLSLVILKKH